MSDHVPAPSRDWSLFLDVDGTLVDFTDTPSGTRSDEELNRLLEDIERSLGGRLALVSGRSIESLDRMFAPRRFAAAGLHGLERRGATGTMFSADTGEWDVDGARAALQSFSDRHPGVLLEDKGRTLALHYRAVPRAKDAVRALLTETAAALGEAFHVQEGHMVMEMKPRRYTKGSAIAAFLEEPPFAGHTPVFIGDDLTDVDGFQVVDARRGVSIAVGERVRARYRIENPDAVRAWLRPLVAMGER